MGTRQNARSPRPGLFIEAGKSRTSTEALHYRNQNRKSLRMLIVSMARCPPKLATNKAKVYSSFTPCPPSINSSDTAAKTKR